MPKNLGAGCGPDTMQDTSLSEPNAVSGNGITVYLPTRLRLALIAEAAERGMQPDEWLESLVRSRLQDRPNWSRTEASQLETISTSLSQLQALIAELPADTSTVVLKQLWAGLVDQYWKLIDGQESYWRVPI
jgi:hypothetical protein